MAENPAFSWQSFSPGQGLTLHYLSGSYAEQHLDELSERSRRALERALEIIGESSYPRPIHVFYTESRDQMGLLFGRRVTGIADPASSAVALVASESWEPFERHEVMHLVSLHFWGQPGDREDPAGRRRGGWLLEGLAAAAEDRCGPASNTAIAGAMREEDTLLPFSALVEEFYEQDDLTAYVQAGSVVEFILDTHGRDVLRRLWKQDRLDFAAVEASPPAGLEREWHLWLRHADTAASGVLAAIREGGCGIRRIG